MKQAGVKHFTAGYALTGMPALGSHIPALDGIRGLAVLVVMHSQYLAVAVYVLFSISATTLVAYLSWHLYEKHFLKLKNRFAPGRVKRIPSPAEAGVPNGQISAAAVPQQQSVGI